MKEFLLALLVIIVMFGIAAQIKQQEKSISREDMDKFFVKPQVWPDLRWKTNSILIMTTNDPGVANFISREDMARELIADGTVCKVHGHIWSTPVPHITSLPAVYVYPPPTSNDYPQVRKCCLCGVEQTRTWSEWK